MPQSSLPDKVDFQFWENFLAETIEEYVKKV